MSDANQSDVQLNDAFKRLEAQVEENQTKPASSRPRAPAPSGKSGASVTGLLGMLLALIALGVASFAAYTIWQMQTAEQNRQSSADQRVSELSQQVSELERQVTRADQSLAQALGQLESNSDANDAALLAVEQRTTALIAELKQSLGTTSEDWLLAEAEYLLRLANQRVAMEDDVAGAIRLFQAADQIIREAEGVVAFELRQAIATDIAALRGVSTADVQGIFVELGALAAQVDRLEQKRLKYEAPEFEASTPSDAEQTTLDKLLGFLVRIGERLTTLVDYRNDGEAIKPILPPEEEYYLKQNLALKLQLAQLGALRSNQEIYQQSLNDALVWVDEYFNSEDALTISIRGSLSRLATLDVSNQLPEVSGSLREIRQLMNQFHRSGDRAASSQASSGRTE